MQSVSLGDTNVICVSAHFLISRLRRYLETVELFTIQVADVMNKKRPVPR